MEYEAVATWQWVPPDAFAGSSRFCSLHGLSPTPYQGALSSFLETLHADDRDRVAHAIAATLSSDEATLTRYRLAAAPTTWLTLVACPVMTGSSRSVCGTCFPSEAEHRAAAASDTDGGGHERTRVMSRVIHDLRNPLNTLLIRVDLLLRQTKRVEALTASERHLNAMSRCVRTMQRLIANWEAYGDIAGARLQLATRPLSARHLLDLALERAQALATDRTLLTEVEVSPSARVVCDAERVVDAITDLVAVAVSSTDSGDVVRLSAVEDAGALCVEVEEGRSDFPLPDLANGEVFDPGLRLGLFVADKIVSAHGGTLEAERERERGTRIAFSLPLAKPASIPAPAEASRVRPD